MIIFMEKDGILLKNKVSNSENLQKNYINSENKKNN